jgi:hypothetical protein
MAKYQGKTVKLNKPFRTPGQSRKFAVYVRDKKTQNVSATISLKEKDWEPAGEWMWKNRNTYNGLSVLPYDGGTYTQAPFEDITKAKYDEMTKTLQEIDLTKVIEDTDNTGLSKINVRNITWLMVMKKQAHTNQGLMDLNFGMVEVG